MNQKENMKMANYKQMLWWFNLDLFDIDAYINFLVSNKTNSPSKLITMLGIN